MGYRLEAGETPAAALRRVAREQLDAALAVLGDAGIDPHEAVHEVRKGCKKIRGLIRLTRPAFEEAYAVENAWYRDTARRVSGLRDAQAFVECFDALLARYASEIDGRRFAAIRQDLIERRDALAEAQEIGRRLTQVRERLEQGRQRIPGWKLEEDGFDALGPGLEKTYRRARKAMQRAYRRPEAATFHEWRKRVKYHRYHCRLLRELWAPVLGTRRDEVERLSDLLGDSHDIAALAAALRAEQARFGSRANRDDLLLRLHERQQELHAWAEPLGRSVFAEKPGGFVRRVSVYWSAWQQRAALRAVLAEASDRSFS